MPPGHWLVTPGNGAILYLGFSAGLCSWQIWHSAAAVIRPALVSELSMLLSPCITSSCHHDHFIHGQLDNDSDDWGEGWLSKEGVVLSTSSAFKWHTIIFTCFAHSERSVHILLPQMSCSPVFHSCSSQPVHWLQPMSRQTVAHLAISPSKRNV